MSTYPVSRLSPAISLVDLAAEIARADQTVGGRVDAQLRIIVEQIRHLQDQARRVLEKAATDRRLHHAQCAFKRIPGKVYHLYQRGEDDLYFSMLSPEEWGTKAPQAYLGSYRLEPDMSWTQADRSDPEAEDVTEAIQRLTRILEGSKGD